VLDFFHKADDQKSGQLFTHGPTLLLIKASHALLDRLQTVIDVEGMFNDFSGDTRNFYRAPCKHVSVALEEVDELAFLFRIQAGPVLHSFSWVPDVDLQGLGVLVRLEKDERQGNLRAEWCHGQPEAELP
jgi:hypothetical protein